MKKRVLKKIAILAAPIIWRRIRGRRRHHWRGRHHWHRRNHWRGHWRRPHRGHKRRGIWL